jgi:hypothetical protein
LQILVDLPEIQALETHCLGDLGWRCLSSAWHPVSLQQSLDRLPQARSDHESQTKPPLEGEAWPWQRTGPPQAAPPGSLRRVAEDRTSRPALPRRPGAWPAPKLSSEGQATTGTARHPPGEVHQPPGSGFAKYQASVKGASSGGPPMALRPGRPAEWRHFVQQESLRRLTGQRATRSRIKGRIGMDAAISWPGGLRWLPRSWPSKTEDIVH